MTAEARHLMSVSLDKFNQARSQRGGMKLCHNLLVATMLHKARSVFMEETVRMVDSVWHQLGAPESPAYQPYATDHDDHCVRYESDEQPTDVINASNTAEAPCVDSRLFHELYIYCQKSCPT